MNAYCNHPATLGIALGITVALIFASATAIRADELQAVERIGVYDSRAVAYAHFNTPKHRKQIDADIAAAKAAQAAGNHAEFARLKKVVVDGQKRSHRQVFSTDPITNVLAQIQDRLPAIQKEAGVTALVSKWDRSTLRKYRSAEQIDVTDRLAAEFHPGAKELKVIEEIKRAKPVSPRVAEQH